MLGPELGGFGKMKHRLFSGRALLTLLCATLGGSISLFLCAAILYTMYEPATCSGWNYCFDLWAIILVVLTNTSPLIGAVGGLIFGITSIRKGVKYRVIEHQFFALMGILLAIFLLFQLLSKI